MKVIAHHIPSLDGLRALAILAVLFHHCGEYYLAPAGEAVRGLVENLGSGVDLFFALSGFLITGILLDSFERRHCFQRFYWRRGLRIWPLYYAFLLTALLLHSRIFKGIGVAPFALYYRNFLGFDPASDVYIGQFWSLCVEEQFYLVWPLVLYLAPKRLRIPLIAGLMLLAFMLRIVCSAHGVSEYVIYRLPFCHMDVLLGGAAVAVLMRHGVAERTLRRICWVAVLLGLAILISVGRGSWPRFDSAFVHYGVTGTSLLFGGVVGLCAQGGHGIAARLLRLPVLRAISTRSYAMYVFHLIPLYASVVLLSRRKLWPVSTVPALLLILGIGLVTYGMAWLSWRYWEEPFLRLKKWEWFATASRGRLRSE